MERLSKQNDTCKTERYSFQLNGETFGKNACMLIDETHGTERVHPEWIHIRKERIFLNGDTLGTGRVPVKCRHIRNSAYMLNEEILVKNTQKEITSRTD